MSFDHSEIGRFHSEVKEVKEAPRQGHLIPSLKGRIELAPQSLWRESLIGLEGFDRIWILFVFHQNSTWKSKVRPPRGENNKLGVFATRSPHRPNNIGLTCAELIEISQNVLHIQGVDLIDQTPVLDIKPYIVEADCFPNAKQGWMEKLSPPHSITFSKMAIDQLDWLKERLGVGIETFIHSHLQDQPLDNKRKRVEPLKKTSAFNCYSLAYKTWRIHFKVDEPFKIQIIEFRSGYSDAEMFSDSDPYSDKWLHTQFRTLFSNN